MSRFEDIQARLETLSPIPVNMPKLYLLGDTGAGKTTIVRRILGTEEFKFPSVQQKRTTVAVTEYVLSRELPYQATYLFKTEAQVRDLVEEILEIATENAYASYRNGTLSSTTIAEDLEETADERFRLRYILPAEQLEELAGELMQFIPTLDQAVQTLSKELQSKEEEIGIIVDLALEQHKTVLDNLNSKILRLVESRVSEVCDGKSVFSGFDHFQHSSDDLESFVAKAKLLLSSAKNSISPVVEYARLQGNLLASWLPKNAELVLIDGEGIGHDTREASRLSARHLDYFHFADSIGLVEECKKPFASGGKSAIEGIVRNGYSEKFNLIFAKLDEVDVGEGEGSDRGDRIRAVKRGLANVKNALREDGADIDFIAERLFYTSNMNAGQIDQASIGEINRLLLLIKRRSDQIKPQFVRPFYDYEMLSSYVSKSSGSFAAKWNTMLNAKHWQTVKAFNRRMCWKDDEFRDMKPISDFHAEVTKELDYFISHPISWEYSTTPSMQKSSIANVKQEFSKQLLAFARLTILGKFEESWEGAMALSGWGSTATRKTRIHGIFEDVLPDYRKPEATQMKDSIKQLLTFATAACKA